LSDSGSYDQHAQGKEGYAENRNSQPSCEGDDEHRKHGPIWSSESLQNAGGEDQSLSVWLWENICTIESQKIRLSEVSLIVQ